jgi:hypothetical protein
VACPAFPALTRARPTRRSEPYLVGDRGYRPGVRSFLYLALAPRFLELINGNHSRRRKRYRSPTRNAMHRRNRSLVYRPGKATGSAPFLPSLPRGDDLFSLLIDRWNPGPITHLTCSSSPICALPFHISPIHPGKGVTLETTKRTTFRPQFTLRTGADHEKLVIFAFRHIALHHPNPTDSQERDKHLPSLIVNNESPVIPLAFHFRRRFRRFVIVYRRS